MASKDIWKSEDGRFEVTRQDTTYEFDVHDNDAIGRLSREEFRQLFLAMKRELGLAGG
jgi:hypothetical protein